MKDIPNGDGLLFNFMCGKTLRCGKNHMYGVECSCDAHGVLCAVCRIGEDVGMAKACGLNFDEGYLFSGMTLKRENRITFIVRLPGKLETWRLVADFKSELINRQACMQKRLLSLSGQEGQSLKYKKEHICIR